MAPALTPSHSSCVAGNFSCVPVSSITVPTDSHKVSAAGSITFNIRSFMFAVAWNGGISGAGAGDEHDDSNPSSSAHATFRIARHLITRARLRAIALRPAFALSRYGEVPLVQVRAASL